MFFSVFDRISEVSEAELAADLERLPEWRRQQALRFRFRSDQILCAKVYLLLCELLKTHFGIDEQPDFAYGKHGKPFLQKFPSIHFNISHCQNAVLCVVAKNAVGCDVEAIGDLPDNDFLNRVCNETEKQQILAAKMPNETFFALWTQKEAILKLSGEGLTDNLHTILPQSNPKIALKTIKNQEKKYIFSIAGSSVRS